MADRHLIRSLSLSLSLILLFLWGMPPAGLAQDRLSQQTHQRLSVVHEMMEQERYDEALKRLRGLLPAVANDDYGRAVVLQTLGYLYLALDRAAAAIEVLDQALTIGRLPRSVNREMQYLLAQLHLAESDYAAATIRIEAWLEGERFPSPDAHALVGIIYRYAGRPAEAIRHLEQAIADADSPKEAWYSHLLAIHYAAARYAAAAQISERMVARFPGRKDYWLELANAYRAAGQERAGVAALESAYRLGVQFNAAEVVDLARHYLHLQAPFKAARLLDVALAQGAIQSSVENLSLLGDAWLFAKHPGPALQALKRAAVLSGDAHLHLRCARLMTEAEDWPGTLGAVQAALDSESSDIHGQAYLLRGVAYHGMHDLNAATAAFQQARDYPATRQYAIQWLDLLHEEDPASREH